MNCKYTLFCVSLNFVWLSLWYVKCRLLDCVSDIPFLCMSCYFNVGWNLSCGYRQVAVGHGLVWFKSHVDCNVLGLNWDEWLKIIHVVDPMKLGQGYECGCDLVLVLSVHYFNERMVSACLLVFHCFPYCCRGWLCIFITLVKWNDSENLINKLLDFKSFEESLCDIVVPMLIILFSFDTIS